MYGLNPGEITTESVSPEGAGWQIYTNSQGVASKYVSESALSNKKVLLYPDDVDPDTRQWWPIFETSITNSQGALVNDYGF